MRVAGIYPQLTSASNVAIRSTSGEPLGLGKVLAIAKAAGCEVSYEMPINEEVEVLVARVLAFDPDLVAFSMMTCQFPLACKIARRLKKKRKDRVIVAGGYHPSAMTTTEEPFDAYIVGEGEEPFAALISALQEGRDWRRGPGLLLRSDRTEAPPRLRNLDRFPWALRDSRILQQKYFGLIYPPPSVQTGFASVEYGRGCTSNCVFCCKNVIWRNGLVFRDPADVVKEMLWLQEERQVNLFFFTDLNFTGDERAVYRLCTEMRRQSFIGAWFCMSNVDTAKAEVLEEMAQTGCVKVMYGIESVNDATLRVIRKCGSFENEKRVLQATLDAGILPHLFYMVGFPWETRDSLLTAASKLGELPGLQLRIGIATPLPGSHWYSQMQDLITTNDRSLFDCEHLVFRHENFTPEELGTAMASLYEGFYHTSEYCERVNRFIAENPRFERSFREYSQVMAEVGFAPLDGFSVDI